MSNSINKATEQARDTTKKSVRNQLRRQRVYKFSADFVELYEISAPRGAPINATVKDAGGGPFHTVPGLSSSPLASTQTTPALDVLSSGHSSRLTTTDRVTATLAAGADPWTTELRTYLVWFQKTLIFVSRSAGIKPVFMAVQTLGSTGTGSQTHLILALLDTKVSVF